MEFSSWLFFGNCFDASVLDICCLANEKWVPDGLISCLTFSECGEDSFREDGIVRGFSEQQFSLVLSKFFFAEVMIEDNITSSKRKFERSILACTWLV
jgi:hypothetical protein